MILKFITIIFVALPSVSGECQLSSLLRIEQCRAKINCTISITDQSSNLKSWECIRHQRTRYNYNYYNNINDYTFDTNYELYIELLNADINSFEDPLQSLRNILSTNIKTLNVIKGNLVSVAPTIYELISLKELVIVENMIEKIDLAKLSYISSLTVLNISKNAISMIDGINFQVEGNSNVHTIDLSYNELETIPDNCFSRFSRLLYLDLSHNLIKKIDLLTFEGMRKIETLLFSHNQLRDMGLNFVRFINLKSLQLDHNELTSLSEVNLKSLTNLEYFDISFNKLMTIEETSFSALKKLQKIDLSNNQIKIIHKLFFKNNINLHTLQLSYNNIDNIEDGVFEGKNITDLSIAGNNIVGTINYSTFLGIHDDMLDLSGGRITNITDKAFSDMGRELTCLILSRNRIEHLSKSCFNNLTALSKLDLSNNNLVEIDIDSTDLKILKEFYLQQNYIKKVSGEVFRNMRSLLILNLSKNAFEELEDNLFEGLKNLETLHLSNNKLQSLGTNVFIGLENLKTLVMSETKIISLPNELFGGLISLELVNISRSQLETIEYRAFDRTGRIEILDISHNMLEFFSVDTHSFLKLRQLYLNHNKLVNITELTFRNMSALEILDLAYNNILYFHFQALQTLGHLNYVNLTFNTDLELHGEVFNNLRLSEVLLTNIKHPFNFRRASNVSITTLKLSECNISDVDILFVYNVDNLSKLILHSNLLTSLSKESFKKMPLLNSLDLSKNKITFIQPGTFLLTDMINTLYLNENDLQTLQFGSLDGLRNLRVLNLSSNAIREFNPKLLRGAPHLSQIYLENNDIVEINVKAFTETSVTTLYIGQNPLACEQLTSLNTTNDGKLKITVYHFDFNTENIDGIPCITYSTSKKDKIINVHNNATDELNELKMTVNVLRDMFSKNLNETTSISKTLQDMMTDLLTYKNEVTRELNQSERSLAKYLQELLDKHDLLRTVFVNSNINVTEGIEKVLLEFNNNLSNWTTNMSNEKTEVMRKLYYNEKPALSTQQYTGQSNKKAVKVDDNKFILYIIAVCLTIQTFLTMLFIFYKCFIKNRKITPGDNNIRDSSQPLNVIEME